MKSDEGTKARSDEGALWSFNDEDTRKIRRAFVHGVEAALATIAPPRTDYHPSYRVWPECYQTWLERLTEWAERDPTTSAFELPPYYDPDEPTNPTRRR